MAIFESKERDGSSINDTICGMYFYYVDQDKLSEAKYIGLTDRIQSITYNPFIKSSDIAVLKKNNYDPKGGISPSPLPKCYRIESFDKVDKLLAKTTVNDLLGDRYDPKCYVYPFSYVMLTDYINNPLLIKPQELSDKQIIVKVITTPVSIESKYCLYVNGYRHDVYGNLEGIVNNFSFNMPVTSNAYSQFLATSGATFSQGNINAMLENDLTLKQGVNRNMLSLEQNKVNSSINVASGLIGTLASVFTGNIGGAINGIGNTIGAGVNSYYNDLSLKMANTQLQEASTLKEQQITSMANAKITDMINTPNSIKTSGSDPFFNMIKSRFKVDLVPYQCSRIEQVNEQFKRYGYKVNRWEKIRKNTRIYYNYIKTNICNIEGTTCPPEELEEIKGILNSGITFWHVYRGAVVKNYDVNNAEYFG